jgi:hypothetical protein
MRAQFIILIFVLMYIGSAECASSLPTTAERNLTVGALLSLHGDNSNGGISSQIALKIAGRAPVPLKTVICRSNF